MYYFFSKLVYYFSKLVGDSDRPIGSAVMLPNKLGVIFFLTSDYRKGKTTQKEWFMLCTVYRQPLLIAFSLTATFKMLQEQGERFIELREN